MLVMFFVSGPTFFKKEKKKNLLYIDVFPHRDIA